MPDVISDILLLGCNFHQELGQQGLEKSIKRSSEEKSKADSSIHHPENHLMNNKTDVEKEEMKKEPESQNTAQEESLRASWGSIKRMEKPISSDSEDCSGTESSNKDDWASIYENVILLC